VTETSSKPLEHPYSAFGCGASAARSAPILPETVTSAKKRDIISINDLQNEEIEEIFALADEYCETMANPESPHQIRGRLDIASKFILATLFYEPSTRTRFSFESAMLRLGGSILGSTDTATTSVSKGESLADTVRVIQNYADLIVLRHPFEGAALAAAECIDVPIINGGDGSHEHPTQTLCDLYTLRREKNTIAGQNVLLVGDLKNGRTVHSLVYGLARFGARIIMMPVEGLELPRDVSSRLESEFGCEPWPKEDINDLFEAHSAQPPVDAVYVAPSGGQQYTLLKHDNYDREKIQKQLRKIDVCYVTRLQGERLSPEEINVQKYPIVNKNFLKGKRYSEARVLHPLPRVSELGYELDRDPRGVYFKQAGYGVPVRMALIAKVLGIEPFRLAPATEKIQGQIYQRDGDPICPNQRCITRNPVERRYISNRAVVLRNAPTLLRCGYCDTSFRIGFVGQAKTKTYIPDEQAGELADLDGIALFVSEDQARNAGYTARGGQRRKPAEPANPGS
jgi:aspartate carbamoyltransferase catalytic subunit